MVRALPLALLLASACTVRNPTYRTADGVSAAEPASDLRAAALKDVPRNPDQEPERAAAHYLDGADLPGLPVGAADLSPPDLGSPENPGCMPDEQLRGNRCYAMLRPFLPVGQKLAAQLCADRGALLACIGGAAENAFLHGLLPPSAQGVWIGLERSGPGKKDFAWASGEPFGYSSWAPGEPNNAASVEDCVVLWGPGLLDPKLPGHWNDAPCSFPRDLLLCERALP